MGDKWSTNYTSTEPQALIYHIKWITNIASCKSYSSIFSCILFTEYQNRVLLVLFFFFSPIGNISCWFPSLSQSSQASHLIWSNASFQSMLESKTCSWLYTVKPRARDSLYQCMIWAISHMYDWIEVVNASLYLADETASQSCKQVNASFPLIVYNASNTLLCIFFLRFCEHKVA